MANTPFLQLPVSVPGASGPLIATNESRPIFPPALETGAYGHWDFSKNSESLINLITGRNLSLAGAAPTYLADSIIIPSGGQNGLITLLNDPGALTVCAVIKIDPATVSGDSSIIWGTSGTSSSEGGSMGYLTRSSGGTEQMNMQSRVASNATVQTLIPAVSIPNAEWVFAAWSRDAAPSRREYSPGAVNYADVPTVGYTPSTVGRKLAFGNAYYPTTTYWDGPQFAEIIVFTEGKSLVDLAAIALRSKARMQRKGISIKNL